MDDMSDATQLIHAIDQGDKQATAEVLPLVYDELKRLRAHSGSLSFDSLSRRDFRDRTVGSWVTGR